MLLSIVITSYNRRDVLCTAINSALRFIGTRPECEIVLVDDASSDGTLDMVRHRYKNEIERNLIRAYENVLNQGVTATKNRGAAESLGDWVMFLDSDDSLIPEKSPVVFQELTRGRSNVLLTFRCCSKLGQLVGRQQQGVITIDYEGLVLQGFPGECLPIVKRSAFLGAPFDGDLRGFEFIGHYRLLSRFGPALVFPDVVRIYDTDESSDRLSTKKNIFSRSCLLAKGFYRLFKLSLGQVSAKASFLLIGKSLWYIAICFMQRLRSSQ